MKKRIYQVVEVAAPGDRLSRVFDISLIILILINVIAMIIESVDEVYQAAPRAFDFFETTSVIIFTLEYVLRVWSCTVDTRYRDPVAGRLRYALSPMAIIDLLAILPFYLPMTGVDLRSFRAVRLFRLLRLAKLTRYSEAMRLLGRVFRSKRTELTTTLFVLVVLILITSSLMYFAERDAQPEKFSSIPATMWFTVATLSTVGYGDICPITLCGKLMGAAIAVLGIGMFALPTGILGAAFVEELQKSKPRVTQCPHCGKAIGASPPPTS